MAEAIDEFVALTKSGRPGPKHIAGKYINQIEPELAAFITVKTVLDGISSQSPLATVAVGIGLRVEDELRFTTFEKENPGLFHTIKRDLTKRTNNRSWQRKVMVHSMNKAGITWDQWPESQRLHVGTKLVGLLIKATGLVSIQRRRYSPKKTRDIIEASADTMELITDRNARCELLSPAYLPMVVPPKDWTIPFDGGYFHLNVGPMVKTHNKNYLEELRNSIHQMPVVYDAINTVQRSGFKVNEDVLTVVREVWGRNLPQGKLPSREDEPIPNKPADIATNTDALQTWKRLASKVHISNSINRSKRLQSSKIIWVAEKFSGSKAIYFPHQMNFRGRVYAVPMFLHPQGCDLSKGLLKFSEGKPIDDARALGWLMIQGANSFGYDKCSFEDRVAWVE